MKLHLKHGQRLAFSKSQREIKKKIEKAVRQHRKRSHLRKQLEDDWFSFWCAIFGANRLTTMVTYTAHKRRKRLAAAVSNNNPLLELMRKHSSMSLISGGRVIGG